MLSAFFFSKTDFPARQEQQFPRHRILQNNPIKATKSRKAKNRNKRQNRDKQKIEISDKIEISNKIEISDKIEISNKNREKQNT